MADFGVVVGLEVKDSADEIRKKIPELQKELNSDENTRLKLIAQLDIEKTKSTIQAQLKSIINTANIPKINMGVNVSANNTVRNAVDQVNEGIQKAAQSTDLSKTIFNAEKLNKEGRMYVSKVTDILETVKNRFLRQGAKDVQFLEFKNANGQLKSFLATVDYGSGIIKKFNFEKAKIDTGGKKANNGFVQTDFMSVSDKSMASYQKTLNFLNTIDKRIADINSKTLLQNKPLQEGTVFYDNYINKLNSVLATIDQVRNSNASLTDEEKRNIGLLVNELKNLAKEQQTAAYPPTKLASTSIGDSVKKYSAELAALEQKWKVQGILVGDFKTKVDQLKTSLSGVGTEKTALDSFRTQLSVTRQEASLLQKSMMETKGIDNLKTKIAVLTNQIVAYQNANGKAMQSNKLSSNNMTFAAEIDGLLAKLKQAKDDTSYRKIANQFRVIKSKIRAMGLEGGTFIQSLWANMKKFASWMGMTSLMTRTSMYVRQLFRDVLELDTAIVDLKKTFKGTEQELESFYYSANDTAKALGTTTKEIIEQASAWSRLGYNQAETAETMAKNSAIFKNISPRMDIDTATDGLVSMMKAFDIEANDVLDGIMSKVNIVGNEFATDNLSIVEAMTRSSSAMAAANNTLEETIALNTASIEITRNAETTANAWRTVAMRLRGYDESTEELSNDLKNITGDIADLTKVASNNGQGISLFTDESKETYKSTYQIIKEIADIWDELSDKNQAELLEKLAGKRNSQVVAAAIKNFTSAEKAMDAMANSAGSAERELNTYMESLAYSTNAFKEAWTGIGQTAINRDDLKNIVDAGTNILEFLDGIIEKLGVIPTILTTITGIAALKGAGGKKMILLINMPASFWC